MQLYEHGGNIYEAARQSGKAFNSFLDYSANINPLGLAASVQTAIMDNIKNVIHYPDTVARELKQEISTYYSVDKNVITVGNGADELLYLLCNIIKPQRILVGAPTFSEYERAACSVGAKIEYFYLNPETDFKTDLNVLISRIQAVDIVFICNPNNPTGIMAEALALEEVLKVSAILGRLVVVDESFQDFLADNNRFTVKPLLHKYSNVIVLQSLTKFFAMPGLRLGCMFAAKELTAKLHTVKAPWNVNSLAQAAGIAALKDQEYQRSSREIISIAINSLYKALLDIPGLHPYKPSVNYILINIKATGLKAAELCAKMLEHNILIRDCSNYRGLSADYIRVAVKLPDDNKKLIAALKKILVSR